MSKADPTYQIVSRLHTTKWDSAISAAVEGWELAAVWKATGTVLKVFVPLSRYTPDQVDTAIRALGAKDEAIESLGA